MMIGSIVGMMVLIIGWVAGTRGGEWTKETKRMKMWSLKYKGIFGIDHNHPSDRTVWTYSYILKNARCSLP